MRFSESMRGAAERAYCRNAVMESDWDNRRIFFWQTISGSRSARQRTDWQRLHQKKPLGIPWHLQASDSDCCDCYRRLVYILHRLVKASNFIINSGHKKVREALLKIQLEFSRITHPRTWYKLWRADRNAFVLYIQSGGLPGGRGGVVWYPHSLERPTIWLF